MAVIVREKEADTATNVSLEDAYRTNLTLLFRYALAMVENETDAEDVLHTVFARLSAKPRLDATNVRAYLVRAVRNECISHVRRKRRTGPLTLVADLPGRENPAAESVNEMLGELAPDAREIVILKVYDNMTFAEIATMIGTSQTTARERYGKALTQMKRILERQ